jgi:hypothetical protein
VAEASTVARRLVWWLIPFAIVAAALGFETDWGRSLRQIEPVRTRAPAQPVTVALMPEYRIDGGLEARKETVDRVLFNPTRRPAPAATQSAAGPSTMKRGQFTLTGTSVVGNTATAFLREVAGGKARSVRKGETLNGMTVAEVTSDRVRLKQGDEFEDLQLKIAAGPRTTVQPAPVVAAAPAAPAAPGAPLQQGTAGSAVGGGAPGGVGSRVPTRPGAPTPAPAQGSEPAAPQKRTTPTSVSEILAERRRAARAAAEAAAAGRVPPPRAPTTQPQSR